MVTHSVLHRTKEKKHIGKETHKGDRASLRDINDYNARQTQHKNRSSYKKTGKGANDNTTCRHHGS